MHIFPFFFMHNLWLSHNHLIIFTFRKYKQFSNFLNANCCWTMQTKGTIKKRQSDASGMLTKAQADSTTSADGHPVHSANKVFFVPTVKLIVKINRNGQSVIKCFAATCTPRTSTTRPRWPLWRRRMGNRHMPSIIQWVINWPLNHQNNHPGMEHSSWRSCAPFPGTSALQGLHQGGCG